MCMRNNGPWGTARQRLKCAWGLLALMSLWFAPLAQAAETWALAWRANSGANGAIQALAIDPTTPGRMYAATQLNGFFRSSNGGASWTQLNGLGVPIESLVSDPTVPGTLYAGTAYWGVYKSIDGGTYWTQSNSGMGFTAIPALLVDPTAPGTVYAGNDGGGGVYKSTNGGLSWSRVNSGLTNLNVLALARDPAGTMYAGTGGGGVFKSTNGGTSWTAVNSGLTNTNVRALVADAATVGTLYAGTDGGGVFKSSNGGTSWTAVNRGLDAPNITALVLDPTMPGTVYAGTNNVSGGVFKSISLNDDTFWYRVNSGINDNLDIRAMTIDTAARKVYAANELGSLYILNPGASGTPLPDSGQSVTLPLPSGGSITASAQQPGTSVQIVQTDSGASVAVVTVGSALLQHSTPGQPVAGLTRIGGLAVLTPSCTAARVVVTATGNTHTAYTDGCPVAVSGAGDAVPTPAQGLTAPQGRIRAEDVQLYLPGPVTQRSALVSVRLDGAAQQTLATQRTLARAGGFNVYVIALVPGNLVARVAPLFLQKQATGGWGELTMPVAALMSNIAPQTADARILIEVLKDTDMRILAGTEIYVGYGTSDEEMLQAGRYRALVRIQ